MNFATLRYDLQDGIATVTIDRPEKNNAISMEMRADFRALADELYANEAVRVAIVTGTGKAFCVGADVSTFEPDWNTPAFRANTRLLINFFNHSVVHLQGHGVASAAATLQEATINAIHLEHLAEANWRVLAMGKPQRVIPPEEIRQRKTTGVGWDVRSAYYAELAGIER